MTVFALVRRARRRLLGNELLSQGANASSAALIAFIALLLFGTQAVDWRWALLIPLAAAGAGLYRARRRLPSAYAVAQIVDHRMALADTLSTALFFSQAEPRSRVSPEIRQIQCEWAGRLAQSVDPRKAVPFTMPRAVYLMAALVLVASSLFALRYGLSKRLDLKPSVARILEQTLGGDDRTEQARHTRRNPQGVPEPPDDGAATVADQDRNGSGQQDAFTDSLDTLSEPASDNGASTESQANFRKQGEEGDRMAGDEPDEDSRPVTSGDDQGSGQPSDGKSGQRQKQPSAANQEPANPGDNSSLLTKVKDAWQNLLSRIKPPQSAPGAQQQFSQDQNSKQGKGQQNGGKQPSGKDGRQQNGGQEGEAQEGQQGQQEAQSRAAGKSDSADPSRQPGSGIGSQDGDKDVKQAEQLAAMGRISEIIGKRSANISGEATVEVRSTSQQLRTPYAQRNARHTEGGAEISRDEIPVALQTYVQQYFEQIRKQAPPKK
jgi:hypothetical protein